MLVENLNQVDQHYLQIISIYSNVYPDFVVRLIPFIEQFCIPALDSFNSRFNLKRSILDFLSNYIKDFQKLFKIFLNGDCNIKKGWPCQKLIELFSRITQGRYQKVPYVTLISIQEERELRELATFNLNLLLKNFGNLKFVEGGVLDLSGTIKKKKMIEEEIFRFNSSGKQKHLKILINLNVLENTNESIAKFLNDGRV